jgi:predicted XRE-type DNA-binding protein
MKMPSEKNLEKMRKKLAKTQGTLMPPANPTPLEKLRWDICQEIVKYALRNDLKSIDLAEKLGVHESEVSRILRHRIDRFSTDKLAALLQILKPHYKIQLKVS